MTAARLHQAGHLNLNNTRPTRYLTSYPDTKRHASCHEKAGFDLDHAVAMVRDRTNARYEAFRPGADPAMAQQIDRISGTALNVSGIMHWLDQAQEQ